MRCIISAIIIFVSVGRGNALTEEQDSRLAALVQYRQSMGMPTWAGIPSSQKPAYAVQHMLLGLLARNTAVGKSYLSLPKSEQSNPIRTKRVYQ
jgi:hypothetical protein